MALFHWLGTDGSDFSDPKNWEEDEVPDATSMILASNNVVGVVSLSISGQGGSFVSATMASGANWTNGGSLTISDTLKISEGSSVQDAGSDSAFVVIIEDAGSSYSVQGDLTVSGAVTVGAGASLSVGGTVNNLSVDGVATVGTATVFTSVGGSLTASAIRGTLEVGGGGQVTVGSVDISGLNQYGTLPNVFTIDGAGSVVHTGSVVFGGSATDQGYIGISGGGALTVGSLTLGNTAGGYNEIGISGAGSTLNYSGTLNFVYGELDVDDGADYTTPGALTVGQATGSLGVIAVGSASGSAPSFTIAGALTLGAAGSGMLNAYFGTTTVQGDVSLGQQTTGHGSLSARGGVINVSGSLTVGAGGHGSVLVNNAGTLNVTGTTNFATLPGAVSPPNSFLVSGAGSKFKTGNLTIGAENATVDQYGQWSHTGVVFGELDIASSGYVSVTHTLTLASEGGFQTLSGSGIEVGGDHGLGAAGGPASNQLLIDAGGRVVGDGTIGVGSIVNNGVIEARNGTLALTPNVTGAGNAQIDDKATLELRGSFAAGGTVTFNGGYQTTLKIDNPNQFHGTIAGLAVGDTIYLPGDALFAEEGDNLAHTQIVGSQLILTFSNNHTLTYNLSGAPSGDVFTIRDMATSSSGNTDIALTLEPASTQIASGSGGSAPVPGHPTGNSLIDSLIWGWGSWAPGATISYWFGATGDIPSAVQSHGDTQELRYRAGAAVDNWNPAEEQDFQKAVQEYAAVAGLHFVQASSAQSANIVWWLEPHLEDNALGISEVPAQAPDGHVWQYFNDTPWTADANQLSLGGDGFNTIVHELGHTLGLAHPHDGGYEPDANTFPKVTGPFRSYGLNAQNQSVFSVMSYNPGWIGQPTTTLDYGTQEGPGALDIAALQQLYGANPSNNPGDNAYTLPTANAPGTGWSCLYDTGGDNTITNAGSNLACTIDLRAAPLTGVNAGGYVSHDATIQGGFTIAHGVFIQNAIGGSGADLLIGGTGNETFTGGGGNDRIIGGSGINTVVYSGLESEYSWSTVGGVTRVTDNRPGNPDGTDVLQNIQDLKFADETAQLEPTIIGPTIAIDPIGDTDILSALEAQDPLTIGGITTGAVGQPVTVTFHNAQYAGLVQGDGTWSATVPTAALTSSMLPDGSYTIKADVTDASGDAAPEATEVLKVRETAPGVASVTASPVKVASAGQIVRLTLHVSAPVTVYEGAPSIDGGSSPSGALPTLSLSDGAVAIYDAAASTPTSMVFDYTVGASDKSANLAVTAFNSNNAAALDIYGNQLDASHALVSTGLAIGVAPAMAVTADFNGDGASDILWRNTNGDLFLWKSNGSGGYAGQDYGVVDNSYQISSTRDFNGDGEADILWRNAGGDALLWNSNGSGGFTGQDFGIVDASYRIAGSGDFNGDGRSDILWRNTGGDAILWKSNGSGGLTGQDLGIVDTSYQVAGIGDFNGNGEADILWRNTGGDAILWRSNGAGGFTGQDFGIVDPSYKVAGIGDFNGDGKADILWRNTGGDAILWQSNGSGGFSGQDFGVVDTSYQVAAIGDFNGDGKTDILWRNTGGDALIWKSNGSGGFTGQDLGVVDNSYHIQGA